MLTNENTAIVLDSTADFPDARERFANLRVVPLYVSFGDESFRDYVELDPHDVLRAAAHRAPRLPTTSQPTPQDFLATYEELAALRARLLAPHLVSALGHVRQRDARGAGEARAATGSG